jgi:DnaK suppressor protein
MSEKLFYSKSELEEFRLLINQKIEVARKEYKRLADNLKELGQSSADTFSYTDFGTESSEKEEVELLMARQSKFINNLEKALMRVENGTYGKCRVTGKLIPKERLRVVPHATTTIEAKKQQTARRTPENKG